MPFQNRSNDLALHANAAAVDDADFPESALDGLVEVFLHYNPDFGGLERVQVDAVFDRNLVHSIQYNRRV